MSVAGFIDAKSLRLSLGPVTYMAIFDDDRTKSIDTVDSSEQVTQCLTLSGAEVMSYMPGIYNTLPPEVPAAVSQLLAGAQLDYAKVIAYRRHPEYVKTYDAGPKGHLEAMFRAKMARIQAATQQIVGTDSPPGLETTPENIGGPVYDDSPKIAVPSNPGTRNRALGDW